MIESPDNDVRASAVSAWVLAVKQQQGKLTLPAPAHEWLEPAVAATGIDFSTIAET